MEEITLRLKEADTIPIEADSINPDLFARRSQEEIKALPVYYGRRKLTLGELFEVEGGNSTSIVVEGRLEQVKKIGWKMGQGRILVRGSPGLHLGAYMSGGEIAVEGNVGDWLGAHMRGGLIRVRGNAGHQVGAGYRGEKQGMKGGTIIVEGDAGNETGLLMRRGLIAVSGNVGDFTGGAMIAGSIITFGRVGIRTGAGMKRGTIVILGEPEPELLPTFYYDCRYRPTFLRLYLRQLREMGLPVQEEHITGYYLRHNGDMTSLGKGEILIYDRRQS
jgi:formylmethanofuran dehydrogenase subunit C